MNDSLQMSIDISLSLTPGRRGSAKIDAKPIVFPDPLCHVLSNILHS